MFAIVNLQYYKLDFHLHPVILVFLNLSTNWKSEKSFQNKLKVVVDEIKMLKVSHFFVL